MIIKQHLEFAADSRSPEWTIDLEINIDEAAIAEYFARRLGPGSKTVTKFQGGIITARKIAVRS